MLLFLATIRSSWWLFSQKCSILDVLLVLAPSSYNTVKCDIKSLSEMVGNTDAFKVSETENLNISRIRGTHCQVNSIALTLNNLTELNLGLPQTYTGAC